MPGGERRRDSFYAPEPRAFCVSRLQGQQYCLAGAGGAKRKKPEPNHYAPGTPTEHFYTNAVRPCPGAPHVLLSFPKRFVPERTKLAGYKEPGVSDAVFMSSRDGLSWSRLFLEAWLRPGPDPHNWTQRSNMPAWGILHLDLAEFSMYIT